MSSNVGRSHASPEPLPESAPGLRERKKLERRKAIASEALLLFREHGFDNVRVSDIARAADVAPQTVFNYFPSKEDIVFHLVHEREQAIVQAVSRRSDTMSILEAVRQATKDLLYDAVDERLVDWIEVVTASEALLAYRVRIYARLSDATAGALSSELNRGPDDLVVSVAARAMIGVLAAATDIATRRISRGHDPGRVRADALADVDGAFDLLAAGLDDFGS